MMIRKRFPAVARQNLYIVSDAIARAALHPATVIDGDIVVQKDTEELWEYNAGTWVRIAGSNYIGTFTDTDSVDLDYDTATQDLQANVKLSASGAAAGNKAVALDIQADGLRAQVANEDIQDAAYGIVADSNSLDITYDDAGNALSADVKLSAAAAAANKQKVAIDIQTDGLRAQIDDTQIRGVLSDDGVIDYNPTTGVIGLDESAVDHGFISGLADDDHTQYALLAGRGTGQTLKGGLASGNDLSLESTGHATKGKVISLDNFEAQKEFRLKLGADIATAGTLQNQATANTAFLRLTGASTLESMADGAEGRVLIVVNATGSSLTVKNDTGATLGNKILTGSGADIVLQANGCLFFAYDSVASRWRVIGGAGGGGYLVNSTQSIAAAGTITVGASQRQIAYVQGNAAAVDADTTTPVSNGSIDGQELKIVGRSDTNTVSIASSGNVRLNGSITLGDGDSLDLFWDATNSVWRESGRSD